MLMITRLDTSDRRGTLKLEGKLLAPWISELETACREALATRSPVCLDLRGLHFVDAEGGSVPCQLDSRRRPGHWLFGIRR